jgi:ATP-dependent DNA helicase RecQ
MPRMVVEAHPLLSLPTATLSLISGDARRRLVGYLNRWGYTDALLGYLNHWLTAQPHAIGLREGHARVLTELGRGEEALIILDAIDAERAPSATRRQLRLRALLAARRYGELDLVLDTLADDDDNAVLAWLLRGDALRARGRFEEAAEAYMEAGTRDPSSLAGVRRLAELALDQNDPAAARGQIDALMLRPDFTPGVADLRILLRAAKQIGDEPAVDALRAQLSRQEQAEAAALLGELGLSTAPDDPAAPVEPLDSPADQREATPARREAPPPHPAAPLLPDAAYLLLRDQFGLSDFRPNQARVIHSVLQGGRTIAVMPTGAGKSLTYQLPAMLLPHATVVVSPLIALMKDQIDGLPAEVRAHATLINSSLNVGELTSRLRGVAAGQYRLVYIAPERLRQRAFLHALKRCGVGLFVIDEVHCLSLWGQSFRPDYLFIGRALEELGQPPVLALTATASTETLSEIRAVIGESATVTASVFRPNLFFQVVRAGNREEKQRQLIELCQALSGPMIVYARARQACEELAALLRATGIAADHYHAQVADRAGAQERFMRGETRVLVATVAFGMGIDKADIRAIVHYNLPSSVEAYYQEAGRAGRDGRPATCVLLYAPSDRARLSTWLDEEALTRDQLRDLYRAVRRLMRGPSDVIDPEQLQRALPGDDDTLIRVGLSMLERVGLLRRHFDLPETAVITLTGAPPPDAEAERVTAIAGLQPGVALEVDLLLLAERANLPPSELEGALLHWHDAGFLRYRGGMRQVLLEQLPAPAGVAERIDQLLADYRRSQEQRIEAMAAYARTNKCRHRTLAEHFGQSLARCKTACDTCAPQNSIGIRTVRTTAGGIPAPLPPRNDDDGRNDAQRALDGLAHLPFALGRTGLARVLKGAATSPVEPERCAEFGALKHLAQSAVEDLIERLITEGYIERDLNDEYRRLSLTILGIKARREPALLPAWVG